MLQGFRTRNWGGEKQGQKDGAKPPFVYGFQNLHLKELAVRAASFFLFFLNSLVWEMSLGGAEGKLTVASYHPGAEAFSSPRPLPSVLIGFVLRQQTELLHKNKRKERKNLCITQKSLNELWAQRCRVLSRLMSRLLSADWQLPGPKFRQGFSPPVGEPIWVCGRWWLWLRQQR